MLGRRHAACVWLRACTRPSRRRRSPAPLGGSLVRRFRHRNRSRLTSMTDVWQFALFLCAFINSAHHVCQRTAAGRRRGCSVAEPLRYSAHRGRPAAPPASRQVRNGVKSTRDRPRPPPRRAAACAAQSRPQLLVFIAARRRLHGNGSSHCFRNGRLGCRQKLNMKFIATAEFRCPPARGPARDVSGGSRADLAHLRSVTGLTPRDFESWQEVDSRKGRLLPPLPEVLCPHFNALLRRQHGTRGRLHARVHAPRAGVGRPAEEVEAFQPRAIGHSPPAASFQKD
jgi:hypothetical protein